MSRIVSCNRVRVPRFGSSSACRYTIRAMVLSSISRLAVHQADLRVAEHAGARSLELYRGLGDTVMAALSLQQLGRAAQLRADFGTARQLLEETLSAYRQGRISRNRSEEHTSELQSQSNL